MLMSAGLPLPRRVFGHGFVYNKDGSKISKSTGTAVDPMDVSKVHGADAFRYYFMRECPFGGDGNYSEKRFAEVYNSDLAKNLGNLYSRTLSMCIKYFDGELPNADAVDATAWLAGLDPGALIEELRSKVGAFEYNVALQRIWFEVLDAANRYIDVTAPFKLAKTDLEACKAVMINLAEALRVIAILIKPFTPKTAEIFYRSFNFEQVQAWETVSYRDAANRLAVPDLRVTAEIVSGKPVPLFPRIDDEPAQA
jgi:methionyl-tRNA synthetase